MKGKEKSIRLLKVLLIVDLLKIPLTLMERALEFKFKMPLNIGLTPELIIMINVIVMLMAIIMAFAKD